MSFLSKIKQQKENQRRNNSESDGSLSCDGQRERHNYYNQDNEDHRNQNYQERYSRRQSRGNYRNLNKDYSNRRRRSSIKTDKRCSQHSSTTSDDQFSTQRSNYQMSQQRHQSSKSQSRNRQFRRKCHGDIQNEKYVCTYGLKGHCKYGWNCLDNHYFMLHMGKWEKDPDLNDYNPPKERPWVNKGIQEQQQHPDQKVLVRIVETKLVSVEEAVRLFKGHGKRSAYRYEIQVAATNKKAIRRFRNQLQQIPGDYCKAAMDEQAANIWMRNRIELSQPYDSHPDSQANYQASYQGKTFSGQMKNQNMGYIPKSEIDAQRSDLPFQRGQFGNYHPQDNKNSNNYHNTDQMNYNPNQFSQQPLKEQQKKASYNQEQPQQIHDKISTLVMSKPPPMYRASSQEKFQQQKQSQEVAQQDLGVTLRNYPSKPKSSGDDNKKEIWGNRLPPSRTTQSPFREDDYQK